jgi:alkyl sulfatase BDS1-like metallo-beta-lactamase superfamily hydrolase
MTTRRDFIAALPSAGAALTVAGSLVLDESPARAQGAAPLSGHFHPRGKAPSTYTQAILRNASATLPLGDTRDFDENRRGLIARMPDMTIMADAGNVAWDMESFQFLDKQESFDSIHPSLHRIGRLNNSYGLYEVVPGIYQIRGFDLAQISFVRGRTGWIVFDVAVSTEVSRAAWKLFQQHRGEGLPVTAIVFSHNHGDHWGGVRGIVDEADVRSGKVPIIAPADFLRHAVEENVYAGNAMNRRLFYQYGLLLQTAPHGYVGQGLGPRVSAGATGLIVPTRSVEKDIESFEVDGVPMVFMNTPNTESPAQMITWLPSFKALWVAEIVNATLHNIYTLRGAPVRDPLRWSKYINETLHRFGVQADVMFGAHHWPRWGNARIQEVLRGQRDIYAHMNNQVLHLANQGVTINEIHNVYKVPKSLQEKWYCRGYHGSPEHNSRGVVQRFLGFWDCNPTTLIPLSPSESAPLYVEMMGGSAKIIARGQQLHEQGQYKLASEIVNKLVQAEPQNQPAKELLADIFEQLGYQQENPGLRNSFLAAAYELRSGIPQGAMANPSSPDVIRAMSTELFLNFLGIRMDSTKAEGLRFTMNLVTPDNGEKFLIELENATLTNIMGYQAEKADLTLTINRSDLEQVMGGRKTLEAQIADGTAKVQGDLTVLQKLASMMVNFDPRFQIMPGTKQGGSSATAADPYQAVPTATIAE